MASIKKPIKYCRKFTSETKQEDISTNDIPSMQDHQSISGEDRLLREEMIERFSHVETPLKQKRFRERETEKYNYIGFDGTFNYSFRFRTEGIAEPRFQRDEETPKKYETTVELSKSSHKNMLEESSDLEEFLLSEGFEKTDDREVY